jgi:hypothetical protein
LGPIAAWSAAIHRGNLTSLTELIANHSPWGNRTHNPFEDRFSVGSHGRINNFDD